MHDDMNRLMRKYAMQVALAGREQSSYFFPDSELEAYTTAWLENILKTCYKNTGPKISAEHLPRVRVYDLIREMINHMKQIRQLTICENMG